MYSYEDIKALVDEIRSVNHAKMILIKTRGWSEQQAQKYIIKSAMDRCVKKRVVAQDIIRRHEREGHRDR